MMFDNRNLVILLMLVLSGLTLFMSGCEMTITANVNQPPIAQGSAYPIEGYTKLEVKFDGSGSYDPDGQIESYIWDFGDGEVKTSDPVVYHLYQDDSDLNNDGYNEGYLVTLTVVDDQGLRSDPVSRRIYVYNPGPNPRITVSNTNPKVGEEVRFDASLSYDPAVKIAKAQIEEYYWDFGDGSSARGMIAFHSYQYSGNFTVTLTVVDDDGATAKATQDIFVQKKQPPEACFEWYYYDSLSNAEQEKLGIEGIVPVPEKRGVVLDGSCSYDPDGTIESYYFQSSDGWSATTKIAGHYFVVGQEYKISLEVKDNDGLTDTTTKYIYVEPEQNPNQE